MDELKEHDDIRQKWREQIERGWQEAQRAEPSTALRRSGASTRASRMRGERVPASIPPHSEAETQIGDIVEFIATEREDAAIRIRDALYERLDVRNRETSAVERRARYQHFQQTRLFARILANEQTMGVLLDF